MRKSTLIALASLVFFATYAQSKDVKQIRADYNELKAWIAKLPEMGETGGMYCLILDDNPQGAAYPGVGHFRTKTHFYYNVEGGQPPVLKMAVESYEGGTQRVYTEAMYDEAGKASFIFASQKTEKGRSAVERRLYMDGDSTLDFTENNRPVAGSSRAQSLHEVRAKADRLMKQFMGIMGYGDK